MKQITQQELRNVQIGILDEIASFCDKAGISYSLGGGTLLGALRHKGYIPWDDDIDVMMPRPDYERFIVEFKGLDYMKVISHKTDKSYPFAFATVNDTRTWKEETRLRKKYAKDVCVNVDVFPIDGLPDSMEDIEKIYKQVKWYGDCLQMATYQFGKGQSFFSTIKKNLGILAWRTAEMFGFVSTDNLIESFSEIALHYDFYESTYCGCVAISHYGTKEVNPTNGFSSTVEVEFEGKKYSAIAGYANYLAKLYGKNYMELPPLEKQKTHHASINYWKDKD